MRREVHCIQAILCFAKMQIAYCEEQVECRRSVLLAHFGESFDVKRCHGTCDVCSQRNGQEFEQVCSLHPDTPEPLGHMRCLTFTSGAMVVPVKSGADMKLSAELYGLRSSTPILHADTTVLGAL